MEEKSIANITGYQSQLAEQVTYVKTLCSELKKKWTHELLSNVKEQVIKRYVQYHQAGIIQLSDMVSGYKPAPDLIAALKPGQAAAQLQINAALENILAFLQTQFYQFFDKDHKATIYCCRQLKAKIADLAQELINHKDSAIAPSLIEVILSSVNDIAEEGAFSGISSRQVEQSLNVLRITHQFLSFGSGNTTDQLVKALYQQNFNSLSFYHWFCDDLSKEIAVMSENEKDDFIGDQLKKLAGVFVSPDKSLHPEIPSTDVYILQWLESQAGGSVSRAKVQPTAAQFPLNLSVHQFALFIRIFYKTGCFPVENVAMITRFFTEHFTTKKQDHISAKSFGRAFYNLDQSAAAIVRDYLQKMLNYLNKTYFP